jgi:hypothetical protein
VPFFGQRSSHNWCVMLSPIIPPTSTPTHHAYFIVTDTEYNTQAGFSLEHLQGDFATLVVGCRTTTPGRQPLTDTYSPPHIHLSPTTVLVPDVLEHYTYNPHFDKGSLRLFEFWFTSSHPSMGSGLNPPGFSKGDKQYLARLTQNLISIMRTESHRTDLIPCILLVNSAVCNISAKIKDELVQCLLAGHNLADLFEVEWFGMQSGSCLVMTTEAHHQQVTTCLRTLAQGDCSKHPVSYDYEMVSLPHPLGPRWSEVYNELYRQRHFQEEMTSTYLYRMEGFYPFTHIPSMSLLPGATLTDVNTHSMAHLLLSRRVEDSDCSIKPSPVTKVNVNEDGTRCFLHARKTDAAQLVWFTARVLQLMTSWLGGEVVIRQNTSETDKIIWSGHALESPATQRQP